MYATDALPFQLGIYPPMMFPKMNTDIAAHEKELIESILPLERFKAIDIFFLDGDEEVRRREIAALRANHKTLIYLIPALGLVKGLDPSSMDRSIWNRTLRVALKHLDWAREGGARLLSVSSGPDVAANERPKAYKAFEDYLTRLCEAAAPDIELMIELFDRSVDKKFLVGPTQETVELIRSMHGKDVTNIGIMLDMAHVALNGESFAKALQSSVPYLRHVHIGTCVTRDRNDPLFGDKHPPIGYPGADHNVPQVAEFLAELYRIGYLGEGKNPAVSVEGRPYPGKTEAESLTILIDKMEEAWALASEELGLG